MMKIVLAYIVISLVVGLYDLRRAYLQEQELNSFPIGDIGSYAVPKKIYGIHNWIFFPSWIVIGVGYAIVAFTNRFLFD